MSENTAFQSRVKEWSLQCFGPVIPLDKIERCDRFFEEALELVQSIGYSPDRAHALTDYVFNRPVGDPTQETGGVMVTLAALCAFNDLDMVACGEAELARVWEKIDRIRAKQAAKPTGSALPVAVDQAAQNADIHPDMARIGKSLIETISALSTEARTAGTKWESGWSNLQRPAEIARLLYDELLNVGDMLEQQHDWGCSSESEPEIDHDAIRRIYQDVADGNTQDALRGLHEAFGTDFELESPGTALRLARLRSPQDDTGAAQSTIPS